MRREGNQIYPRHDPTAVRKGGPELGHRLREVILEGTSKRHVVQAGSALSQYLTRLLLLKKSPSLYTQKMMTLDHSLGH